jgi:histidine kinase
MERVEALAHTENVVGYMLSQLRELPEASVEAMAIAARTGETFSVSLVAGVAGLSRADTLRALAPALVGGLIEPRDQGYYFNPEREHDDDEVPDFVLRFSHDRVQAAASSTLTPDKVAATRLRIGQLMLSQLDDEAVDARLFEVVEHLNAGLNAVDGLEPRRARQLIALDTRAGHRALRCAAYASAHTYLGQAIALLAHDDWQTRYQDTLDLYVASAEAAYLAGDHEAMEARVTAVEAHARDLLDKTRAREIRVRAFVSRNEHREGVKAALAALAELGVHLPPSPTQADVGAAAGAVVGAVTELGLDALVAIPDVADAGMRASRRILEGITSAAYLSTPNLLPLIAFELVGSTIRHGASKESPYGLVVLGLALAAGGHFELSYAVGQSATRMLERWNDSGLNARVLHIWNTHARAFRDPFALSADALSRVYELGVSSGDLEYACWAGTNQGIMNLYSGRPLAEVAEGMAIYGEGIGRYQQFAALECHRPFVRWVASLRGEAAAPWSLNSDDYNEVETWDQLLGMGFRGALFLTTLVRVAVRTLFGRPRQALDFANLGEQYQDGATATVHLPMFLFYDGLASLALTWQADAEERDVLLERARGRREALAPFAEAAPQNHAHRVGLLDAELLACEGDTLGAMSAFDRAIGCARDAGSNGDEALANELAGRFHRRDGRTTISRGYLMEAHYGWRHWGADGKARQLELEFDDLLLSGRGRPSRPGLGDATFGNSATTAAGTSDGLDLTTLARTHQALSRHTRLGSVLDTIVRVVVQNAGATGGFLVLDDADGHPVIRASEDAEGNAVVAPGTPLRTQSKLPVRIVQFVARTGERLVLADATRDPRFEGDIRLRRASTLSVLCSPIHHLGTNLGILYLENDLASGAFDSERSQVVDLLGTQAAISIQNALLIENLEDNVAARTQELEVANTELRGSLEKIRTMQKQIIVQEKLASLGSLTAGIAHELQNPLNFINNFSAVSLELVEELGEVALAIQAGSARPAELGEVMSDLKTNSSKIHEHGNRAANIIRNLLDHARKSSTDRERVALNDLVQHAVKLGVEGSAVKRSTPHVGVALELDGDAGSLVVSRSDLERVVINIVDNACYAMNEKSTRDGAGFSPSLWVSTRRAGDVVTIRIRDNGTGMSPDVLANVFNPFFTTKPTGEGTGLGLSLSYDIVVNGHQGELTVESQEGTYTEFALALPVRAGDLFER